MGEAGPAYGTAYRALREALTEVLARVAGADPGVRDREVPACPGWTVGDTLAHLVGVVDDALAGRLDGVTTDPWTAAQVEARRGRTIAEMLDEWSALAPAMEDLADQHPAPTFGQWLFDGVTHELDVLDALGERPDVDAPRYALAATWVRKAWVGYRAAIDAPPLTVVLDGAHAEAGEGAAGEPADRLVLAPVDALRALSGRRTLDEVRSLPWTVSDPQPHLDAFTWGPFTVRDRPLGEAARMGQSAM